MPDTHHNSHQRKAPPEAAEPPFVMKNLIENMQRTLNSQHLIFVIKSKKISALKVHRTSLLLLVNNLLSQNEILPSTPHRCTLEIGVRCLVMKLLLLQPKMGLAMTSVNMFHSSVQFRCSGTQHSCIQARTAT